MSSRNGPALDGEKRSVCGLAGRDRVRARRGPWPPTPVSRDPGPRLRIETPEDRASVPSRSGTPMAPCTRRHGRRSRPLLRSPATDTGVRQRRRTSVFAADRVGTGPVRPWIGGHARVRLVLPRFGGHRGSSDCSTVVLVDVEPSCGIVERPPGRTDPSHEGPTPCRSPIRHDERPNGPSGVRDGGWIPRLLPRRVTCPGARRSPAPARRAWHRSAPRSS